MQHLQPEADNASTDPHRTAGGILQSVSNSQRLWFGRRDMVALESMSVALRKISSEK